MNEPLRMVIAGASGRLGAALMRHYSRDDRIIGFNRQQLDLAKVKDLESTLQPLEFKLLINCAAQTNVDRCETHRDEAFALNAEAPRVLAKICTEKKARMIHISTDYVFDGGKAKPYTEDDEANPISVYGASKLEGEKHVLAVDGNHLVVRVSWVFGPDRPSFVDWVVDQARNHDHVEAIADKISTPTYTLDIAELLRPFLVGPAGINDPGCNGIMHLANRGACSWREYGQWALDCCQAEGVPLRARVVGAVALADMKSFIARRPIHSVLGTAKYERLTGQSPRDWRDAVASYVREHIAPSLR